METEHIAEDVIRTKPQPNDDTMKNSCADTERGRLINNRAGIQ